MVSDGADALTAFERARKAVGRRDGRARGEIRPLRAELDVLERCDGSARLQCGSTVVLACVYGPMESTMRNQRYDRAVLTVSVRPPSTAGGTGVASGNPSNAHAMEAFLREALSSALLLTLHPRGAALVVVHVLEDAGSTLAAALNAACLALMDAGWAMKGVLCAAAVAVNSAGALVVDPTRLEQEEAVVHATFVFDGNAEAGDVVAAKLTGFFDDLSTYDKALDTAQRACTKLRGFLRVASGRRVQQLQSMRL